MIKKLTQTDLRFVQIAERIKAKTYEQLEKAAAETKGGFDLDTALTNRNMCRALYNAGIALDRMDEFQLSDREFAFVAEYVKDWNATAAVKRLGYVECENTAARFMAKPGIRFAIYRKQAAMDRLIMVNADRVLEEYAKIAFSDITDFVTFSGGVLTVRDSDEIDGSVIEEISEGPNGLKLKLHNKMKALEVLAKHTGVARDRVEITGADGKDLIDTNPMAALISKLDMISKNKDQVEKTDKGSIA